MRPARPQQQQMRNPITVELVVALVLEVDVPDHVGGLVHADDVAVRVNGGARVLDMVVSDHGPVQDHADVGDIHVP